MSTTINAYSVSLGLDASKYIDASKMSRQETSALTRDINAARTPAENLARKTELLEKAYKDGAISLEVYNRLLEHNRTKLLGADGAQSDLLGTMSKVGNVVSGVRHAFDMVGNAVGFVMDQWAKFDEIANGLDDANDRAKKLGLTFNELGSLEFATNRLGGAEALAALDSAIGIMLKKGFVQAGESAVDAFKRAASEIEGMATQTERAQRAAEIFGRGGIELLGVLQSGSDEIGELADHWERTNGLTQTQLEFVGDYNDRWEDVKMQVEGIVTVLTAEMAVPLTVLANELLGMGGSMKEFRDNARLAVDSLVNMVGYAKDLWDIYDSMAHPFDVDKGKEANALDTASKLQEEVLKQRQKIENEQTAESIKKLQNKNKLERDSFDDLIDGNAKAWDTFLEDKARKSKDVAQDIANTEKRLMRELDREWQEELRLEEKQRSIVARGPAAIEAGSAEEVKFMAEQVNAAIAESLGDNPDADKQQMLAAQANTLLQEANAKLNEAVEQLKQNGFKRFR